MKKTLTATLMALALCGCNNNQTEMENPFDGPVVVMKTSSGTMKIKLYNATPSHRDNFLKLADTGFYDSLAFHRIIPGFMIQGGDPLSKNAIARDAWGTGGPGYTVPAEFVPELKHCKGAVAAARKGDMANPRRASSGSQFYIVQDSLGCRHLDGQYTVFGQVVEGLDVIDRIAAEPTDPYDRPFADVKIISVFRDQEVSEDLTPASPESIQTATDPASPESTPASQSDRPVQMNLNLKKK